MFEIATVFILGSSTSSMLAKLVEETIECEPSEPVAFWSEPQIEFASDNELDHEPIKADGGPDERGTLEWTMENDTIECSY